MGRRLLSDVIDDAAIEQKASDDAGAFYLYQGAVSNSNSRRREQY